MLNVYNEKDYTECVTALVVFAPNHDHPPTQASAITIRTSHTAAACWSILEAQRHDIRSGRVHCSCRYLKQQWCSRGDWISRYLERCAIDPSSE